MQSTPTHCWFSPRPSCSGAWALNPVGSRGSRTSARHTASAFTKWLPAVSSRRKDPICRPESRRIDSHSITRELYGHGRSLAASDGAGGGFPGFHAQDQDSPLVWGHTEHEEHVRRSARREIWMAEEYSSLEGHSGEHPRSVRHRSDPLRYRGRHCCDGRKRATQRHPSSSGKDRTCG